MIDHADAVHGAVHDRINRLNRLIREQGLDTVDLKANRRAKQDEIRIPAELGRLGDGMGRNLDLITLVSGGRFIRSTSMLVDMPAAQNNLMLRMDTILHLLVNVHNLTGKDPKSSALMSWSSACMRMSANSLDSPAASF